MAGFIEQPFGLKRPLAWLDGLEALVARELAPSARKIRTALRIATIVTIAIGLDAICHVNTQLGAVIVWLLAGAGPMMSIRKALAWQIAVMLALIMAVVMARAFAETPWSVCGWIRHRRLEQCRQDLADPAQERLSITHIAFRWGFNDVAHFSRSFRETYQQSPRDLRRRAA